MLSVLSGGVHGAYAHWKQDPELKTHYSLKNAADAAGFYNDIGADSLAREHPTLSFMHAAPGFVNTNWGTELPWIARCAVRCLQPLGISPATCAEYMVASLLDPARGTGFHVVRAARPQGSSLAVGGRVIKCQPLSARAQRYI